MAQLNDLIVTGSSRFLNDVTINEIKTSLINNVLIGSGTAASDKGSGVSPRYFPATWTFNSGHTPVDGDLVNITIPVAGHGWGVWISIDGGSTYHPGNITGTTRLTTHYGVGTTIQLVFDADGQTNAMTPITGADAVNGTNVTGGCWRVINFYDTNSNNYDRNRYTGTILCGSTAIVAANIIVGKDGVYHHLKDGTAFDITYPILYANSAIAANATGSDNYDVLAISLQTTQTITLTLYKPVFIKGTLAGNIFTPVSTTPLTQTIPAEFDEYYYILLGVAYSNKNIYLNVDHSIYAYVNGKFSKIFDDLVSHAEGNGTCARGDYSHSEGTGTTAYAGYTHAEGRGTSAGSSGSHAEGYNTRTSNLYSHAEGFGTTASGSSAHAEGYNTGASSTAAHAEGYSTKASADYSHAEGYATKTISPGSYSHAEGFATTANGGCSHTEGRETIVTNGASYSHAEGYKTSVSSSYSHAEGSKTLANGGYSHAEGAETTADGDYSHTEGYRTLATRIATHSEGAYTTASNAYSKSLGHYSAAMTTGGAISNTTGTALVIGNGTYSTALSNAFSVQFDGTVKAASTITASTTADYAEYFEWADENPNNEDRVGYFVAFSSDNKIKIGSTLDEYILGVSSGEPFVLGNGDCDVWNGMVLRDEFRRIIYEPAPKLDDEENPMYDDQGNPIYEGTRPKINPKYDPTIPYINRADRPEWQAVGMLGVLAVRDNGLCSVNSYCTVAADGTAKPYTNADIHKYRVIHRNSNDVIEIVFR